MGDRYDNLPLHVACENGYIACANVSILMLILALARIKFTVHARALHGTGAGFNLSKMMGVGHNFENFNIVKA